MCGITGVFAYGWPDDVDPAVISRMRDAMTHRGPDDAGVWVSPDGRVGLGHRRLSIVDLSADGRQPMSSEDGSVRVVFNGEIYNHGELRPRLEASGHRYRSRTDTETLVHLYEEHGTDMLPLLRGMFAFAIWDERRRRLFLGRDRIGIKPLYHASVDGRFLFGSEIKAMLAHPALTPDLDTTALYHYLTYYTAPAPSTLFRGVSKLPAGHAMTVDAGGETVTWRWWDLADAPAPADVDLGNEEDVARAVRRGLEESVLERLMADVPYGVMLSGGVDSTAIAGLVQRHHTTPVRTFSVGYTDAPTHDETDHARRAAGFIGSDHHEILIDQHDLVEYVPQLIHSQDEPLADWVCVPLYYVSKLVRDSGTIVALVGEGSDEQFAGYRHYQRYMQLDRGAWRWYNSLPRGVRAAGYAIAGPLLRRSGLPREVRELVRRAAADEPLFLSGAVAAWETDKADMMSARMRRNGWGDLSSVPIARAAMDHFAGRRGGTELLEQLIYQEFQLRLPELLLMRVDKITMSTSIEARVPFLDHRLVELVSHVPPSMKVRNGRTKHVLKEAVRGLVPDSIVDREKQGFSAPVKEWFRNELADYARRSILDSRLRERELFDYEALGGMLEAHRIGKRNYDTLLWSLVNLSQWYDQWIAGDRSHAVGAW